MSDNTAPKPEMGLPQYMTRPEAAQYTRISEEQIEAANTALIEQYSVDDLLPRVQDTRYDTHGGAQVSSGPLSTCDSFYGSPGEDAHGFISLVSFSLGETESLAATSIISEERGRWKLVNSASAT